jgi:uncharacterized peroxidase-related enzyme
MRLPIVERGKGIKGKLMLTAAPVMIGAKAPDIMRVLFYRPRFFGKAMGVLTQSVLRGPSEWTVGERELFAAFVSARNRCRFCRQAHEAVTTRSIAPELVSSVLAGEIPEELGPKVKVMLPFLEKLTVAPDNVSAGDLFPLRQAGISDAAIADAAYVCMLFCTYNRIADALDFELMEPAQLEAVAKALNDKGYDI